MPHVFLAWSGLLDGTGMALPCVSSKLGGERVHLQESTQLARTLQLLLLLSLQVLGQSLTLPQCAT